ncbi:MAG: gliding motility lipoprotein GldB [Bacteroidetes bacterium]|nr:MAG: gliding motility lipoprotein GldB [Bacteroidota bacterium]
MRNLVIFLFLVSFAACSKKENNKIDVSNIDIETKVIRFDQKFYTTPPEKLADLKAEFPYLFPQANPDSVWVNKMKNKDEQELFAETEKVYNDFTEETKQLTELFKHIKYYYPRFKQPKVITLLSNVDYDSKVVLADSLLFISLDVFLGTDSPIYQTHPNYIKQNNNKEHLIVAVAEQFAKQIIPPTNDKSFVSKMVQEGKKLALIQIFLPNIIPQVIIGYTVDQYEWAEKSEAEIWKYFIQKEYLYSSDHQLTKRFIEDAPFSKFFLEVDKDSPGRIGMWFGWRIVDSYLSNNETGIRETMITDNEEIFKNSRYKPKKQ